MGNQDFNKFFKSIADRQKSIDYFRIRSLEAGFQFDLDQTGGYMKGQKLVRNTQTGKKQFTVKVTPQLRRFLNLPPNANTYGTFYSRKPVEAASRAFTQICRDGDIINKDCPSSANKKPPMTITMLDIRNKTAGSDYTEPKENTYWIKKVPNPDGNLAFFYRSSGNKYKFKWKPEIIPMKKQSDYDDSSKIKAERSEVSRKRYKKCSPKLTRYDNEKIVCRK